MKKNFLFSLILTALLTLSIGASAQIIEKAKKGIEKGVEGAEKGVKKGARATKRGVKKAAKATEKGAEKGAEAVEKTVSTKED